ncbi:septal ring lytic transglycosylase RlpA family protein [Synechococcus sp. PCC 7336]|uniref:septal ring lytic transglycosylase RlpA family protein n=1 Tax=Synechococcus sp. PCC 7336 TaxID=195250 RepID=UPI00034B837B|nr:septal ring lytic transglycosylase RlpA family protein [Synechococcus sp. PCC 7336]
MTRSDSSGIAFADLFKLSRSVRYLELRSRRYLFFRRQPHERLLPSAPNSQKHCLSSYLGSIALGAGVMLGSALGVNYWMAPLSDRSSDLPQAPAAVVADERLPEIAVATVSEDGVTRNHVLVNDIPVTSLSAAEEERARLIASELKALAAQQALHPEMARPAWVNGEAVGAIEGEVIFTVDSETAAWYDRHPSDLAAMWINNLRIALDGEPLSEAAVLAYQYGSSDEPVDFEGLASWYGPYFYGRPTASGELFVPGTFTAAHKSLPLGTYLHVTALHTGRATIVRVNDRGPYVGARVLDLSETVARELGILHVGVSPVRVRIIDALEQSPS